MKRNITLIICSLLLYNTSISQEFKQEEVEIVDVKPFRIGIKIGFPNIIGGNIEYVTPLFGNKLALSVDYSLVPFDSFMEPDEGSITYFEGGINYYFFKEGRGLYGSVSYGMLNANVTIMDVESDNDYEMLGTGTSEIINNTFNIKMGAKLGKGFYFRPEIGYSFNKLPSTITYIVTFPDGSSETQIEDFLSEADILTKGIIVNIGFGISF